MLFCSSFFVCRCLLVGVFLSCLVFGVLVIVVCGLCHDFVRLLFVV